MIVKLPFPATLCDLMSVKGKSELINGRIVVYPPMGGIPGRVQQAILFALHDYAVETGCGEVFTRSLGYALPAPLKSGRQSFCADASYHVGPWPENPMGFIPAAPTFAVEVMCLPDYEPGQSEVRAAKRADYFEAGTLVVWDVDPVGQTVTKYDASDPTIGTTFRPGDTADAEPAVPGWRLDVTALFA